ncbi:MAG: DUF1573 domain-containing protein [Candidatus Kapabacteria bacterium]|nr:DUF1573 domain-containing protein [Candidatus Kapabacteria bacterium]
MKIKVFLCLIIYFFSVNISFSQPKIEILGGDTYNWGRVSIKKDPLTTTIKILNTGNKKLIISEVKPACGCTTAELDKSELNPGDTANLPIVFRITGTHNKVSKTVRITSNDPVNKDKIFRLEADVFYPIELIPGNAISFGDMEVGRVDTTSVIIINNTGREINLSGFEPLSDDCQVVNIKDGRKNIPEGEEFELKISAKPKQSGFYNSAIQIKVDYEEYSELKISCFGMVK